MQIVLLAGLVILAAVVQYLVLRARITRLVLARDPAQEVRDELASIMVEINRTTEQNVAVVEDRIRQLTELIGVADRRIALLRRETERHEVSRQVYSNIVRRHPQPAPEKGPAPAPPPADTAASAETDEPLDRRVLQLSREGFSPATIAGRLGTTVGEVELIISLNRHRT